MLKKLLLPTILILLAYGFWISPDFKVVSAGVAVFLLGMIFLEQGFKAFTGGILEKILHFSTNKMWKSLTFGIVSTSLLQSSSLVSVIAISFLSAGLIGLSQGIGIIFGANLGTTTGAWLVAAFGLKVNIGSYAMPFLVFGLVFLFDKNKALQGIGNVFIGVGLLFLGIHYMKEGFEAFRASVDLSQYAMTGTLGLLFYTLIGIVATVVMQSSHATLILIITALASHQVSYENSLAVAIGANVGTTITAILGALSANIQGKRLAAAHLVFNVSTGAIALLFIEQMVWVVSHLSNVIGIDSNNYTLQLALFHTVFNTIGIVVLLPFLGHLVKMLINWLPDIRGNGVSISTEGKAIHRAKFLNEISLNYPETAIQAMVKESVHLFQNAYQIVSLGVFVRALDIKKTKELKELLNLETELVTVSIDELYQRYIKGIYADILRYGSQIEAGLSVEQSTQVFSLKLACRKIVDAIKDIKHLHKNLANYVKSDDEVVREQYDLLRLRVIIILKQIYELRLLSDADELTTKTDLIKLAIAKQDIGSNGTLEQLIRKHRIDPLVASSLINDSGYVHSICNNLVDSVIGIFRRATGDIILAEQEMELDQDELMAILKKHKGSR